MSPGGTEEFERCLDCCTAHGDMHRSKVSKKGLVPEKLRASPLVVRIGFDGAMLQSPRLRGPWRPWRAMRAGWTISG